MLRNTDMIPTSNQLPFQRQQDIMAYVQRICSEYGLHGNVISFSSDTIPESDRNRDYIIAGVAAYLDGTQCPPEGTKPIDPERILREIQRSDKFFHPHIWAYDLSACADPMKATEALVEYCKTTEFLKHLYEQYSAPLPAVLRTSEISQLMDAWDALNHPDATPELQAKIQKEFKQFFDIERDEGKSDWMNYYRSDRHPDGRGAIARARGFLHRSEQIVDMDQLLEFNDDVHQLQMQEHEFRLFQDFMATLHPDVTYSVGKLEIVDNGIEKTSDGGSGPFGRSVSGEEYAVIRKEHFAQQGWDALAGLNMAYFEFRDVCYKAVDEPLVAAVYNKITLEYAKCDPITELMEHGPMHLAQISSTDFMNFVSLAKANGFRFYIDTDGIYAKPSLEHVNVIYNEEQTHLLQAIKARMIHDKVNHSHVVDRPALQARLSDIDTPGKAVSRNRHIPSRD